MSEGYGWDITVYQLNYWQKLAATRGLLSSWVTQNLWDHINCTLTVTLELRENWSDRKVLLYNIVSVWSNSLQLLYSVISLWIITAWAAQHHNKCPPCDLTSVPSDYMGSKRWRNAFFFEAIKLNHDTEACYICWYGWKIYNRWTEMKCIVGRRGSQIDH